MKQNGKDTREFSRERIISYMPRVVPKGQIFRFSGAVGTRAYVFNVEFVLGPLQGKPRHVERPLGGLAPPPEDLIQKHLWKDAQMKP